jgi:flavin reductase (DIM6/NTAB) family NADH-FMN oxidoreductase RutF
MIDVNLSDYLNQALDTIPKGAFLTVKSGNNLNTMTIGWGSFGYIWGKQIIMVMVRKSRYTYSIIEKTDNFSISIPFHNNLRKELSYCGSYSGRDVDKFEECNLKTIPGKAIDTPIIKGCNLHLECKIKFKQEMDKKLLANDYREKWYPESNFHTLYFGELLACYIDETIE